MPPTRSAAARRLDHPVYTAGQLCAKPRPNPYAAWLCPTLARDWSKHIAAAMAAVPPERADAFMSIAAAPYPRASPQGLEVEAEVSLLRVLAQDSPHRRLTVAKHCFALIGANLPGLMRLRGVECLRAAAQFGTPRLAAIVKACVPSADAPECRLAVLESLWRDVGPEQLTQWEALTEILRTQRRGLPGRTAQDMQRILKRAVPKGSSERVADRFGINNNEMDISRIDDTCVRFLRDNDENVMLSSRIEQAALAIDIVRGHVPDAMHFAPVLACVQLFVEGVAQFAEGQDEIRAMLALQTLTGKWRAQTRRWRERPPIEGAPTDSFYALLDDSNEPADDRRMWRNIRLDMSHSDTIGMGELCALVWQVIHRFDDPEKTPEQKELAKANMRHALVCALAECSEEGGIVCPVGVSQRLLNVLQGYLPFTIDSVEHEAHPQAVVTYLMQQFHHRVEREDSDASDTDDWDEFETERAQRRRAHSFYQEALTCGQALFATRPKAHDTFKRHLVTSMRLGYDIELVGALGLGQ